MADGFHYQRCDVRAGDCLIVLRAMPDASVDAIVTDPPYGLAEHKPAAVAAALTAWAGGDREQVPDGRGFMGRAWDAFVPPPAVWDECLRVLKPGGHLVAFSGARTQDLMGLSIRLAGFEIRDGLTWLYGSGFPKSRNVSKDMDRMAGAEREIVGTVTRSTMPNLTGNHGLDVESADAWRDAHAGAHTYAVTAPATDAARQWQGWGTALKPAQEPMILARKPLGGTVAATVLAHGTGALNVDATRVPSTEQWAGDSGRSSARNGYGPEDADGWEGGWTKRSESHAAGRWPTNVVLSHAPLLDDAGEVTGDACADGCVPGCAVAELDAQSGTLTSGANPTRRGSDTSRDAYGEFKGQAECTPARGADSGGASRFYPTFRYQAKAPARERPKVDGVAHPTVKPLGLMRWAVRLVTPPGGVVLDPFAGSGATGEAAELEGFASILIEREPTYLPLIEVRRERAAELNSQSADMPTLFDLAADNKQAVAR